MNQPPRDVPADIAATGCLVVLYAVGFLGLAWTVSGIARFSGFQQATLLSLLALIPSGVALIFNHRWAYVAVPLLLLPAVGLNLLGVLQGGVRGTADAVLAAVLFAVPALCIAAIVRRVLADRR